MLRELILIENKSIILTKKNIGHLADSANFKAVTFNKNI